MRTSDLPPTLIPRSRATYLIPGIFYARAYGGAASSLVRGASPRPALAANARPVLRSRLGGDAAADAGAARDPALRRLDRALADGGVARRRVARGRDPRVAGAGLKPPRRQPPPRGSDRRRRGLAGRPHGASGRRRVHGGGREALRVRRARATPRHERQPSGRTP